jgi:hypothetical protein
MGKRQFAALPFRLDNSELRVMLITTRRKRRWSVPKGSLIRNTAPHRTAALEAYEEAGVIGAVAKRVGQLQASQAQAQANHGCRRLSHEGARLGELVARERRARRDLGLGREGGASGTQGAAPALDCAFRGADRQKRFFPAGRMTSRPAQEPAAHPVISFGWTTRA